jgi:release factor glutamine methyltransferase
MNETELLFTEILSCNRSSLYLNTDLHLDKNKSSLISSALKRRAYGEPIQYILGKIEFMGLEFKVSPDVFIPRPETEILVETVIKYATSHKLQATSKKILDVGTGSGCIAISLAKFLPNNIEIDAIDISKEALEIAQENARLNNAGINFMQGDLFNACDLRPATCDLIVSNPPYIPSEEIEILQPEIRYEPRIAIDGGKDGLYFYRRLIGESPNYLKQGGLLIMEIGFNQKNAIKNIFKNSANYKIIEVIKDYNNIERVIVAKRYG